MKRLNVSLLLSAMLLGLSFIVGCIFIQRGLEFKKETANEIKSEAKVLMTKKEAAAYLNLTEEQVTRIIETENHQLSKTGVFTGMMFPYIKIDNEILISRDHLKEWLKEATTQRNEYESRS